MAQPALAKYVLESLLERGAIDRHDPVLAVCAGEADRALFDLLGFTDVNEARVS